MILWFYNKDRKVGISWYSTLFLHIMGKIAYDNGIDPIAIAIISRDELREVIIPEFDKDLEDKASTIRIIHTWEKE